ncbi:oxidoreductase [Bacillus sp. J14TS2]|uniref:Gfo/Idh/MocA family protein n=1 Tax=Bacillus sp. J14TS2 TaxID=2807188 RepID=UPI001B0503AE|nr:Gfo/Idh/MocA family oxidoreductase [Bacillus sp. J14TS2]GIN70609.1 oxidoreductase [Bacillus sp. J14TS2]
MNLKVGIAGGKRGKVFYQEFSRHEGVEVVAIMDPDQKVLDEFTAVPFLYTEYDQLLECDLDIVVIASPMQYHAQQAIAALNKNIHVLSEVTAATTVEECQALLEAAQNSQAQYMLGENYCYIPENICIKNMVAAGLFGDIYYAEGEYVHNVRALHHDEQGKETWRKKMQVGRAGITYGTHSLGPVLQWMDEKIAGIYCVGSGASRYPGYTHDDTTTMLCKTGSGAMIRIRLDLLSNRPHQMNYYSLQGTKGCYEAARSKNQEPLVWIEGYAKHSEEWLPLSDFYDEYLPFKLEDIPNRKNHWGGDYLMVTDFLTAIKEDKPVPINIHQALEMTLPGILSEESIMTEGKMIEMPYLSSKNKKELHENR